MGRIIHGSRTAGLYRIVFDRRFAQRYTGACLRSAGLLTFHSAALAPLPPAAASVFLLLAGTAFYDAFLVAVAVFTVLRIEYR